ncbi:MAG: ABC transporter permease [bacterium]|nr:ABC transporter permease [Candidatus Sumerlaeota bacterium]
MNRPLRQQIELVFSLAKRDLKARYKDSVLGFLWSLFRPAFLTLILWIVFSKILDSPFQTSNAPYWLHVLISILVWNFFAGSLFDATLSVVGNASLLKKVRLDTEVFPIAAILSNGVHFALAFGLAVIAAVLAGAGIHWQILLLPLYMLILVVFLLGMALWLSALNVYYRDVANAIELAAMAWFYLTPIIYPLNLAAEQIMGRMGRAWFNIYMLNPMTPIVVAFRAAVLGGGEMAAAPLAGWLAAAFTAGLILTLTGWLAFRRLSWRFADEL